MFQSVDDDWEMVVNTLPKLLVARIETNVANRFAKTLITSKMENVTDKAQEATFSIVTPDQAFISGFTLEVDGKLYESTVKEKEEAKQAYDVAVSQGLVAAYVATTVRDSNRFSVSVNIEPQSKVAFYLRYEELLVRKDNKYELVLNMNPEQFVDDFEIAVNISESRPLQFVKVPNLRSGNEAISDNPALNPGASVKMTGKNSSVITFKPDIANQKNLSTSLHGKEGHGLTGQFIVQYDVFRDPQGGEVLIDESGYFIHFFIPDNLPALSKDVIFVLDVSGSMQGQKIIQLKQAMHRILGELKSEDTFSIIEFNSEVSVWNIETSAVSYVERVQNKRFRYEGNPPPPEIRRDNILPSSVKATKENVKKAEKVIDKLHAAGSTDILSALILALKVVTQNKTNDETQPIIVFLTDGKPTVGTYNTGTIITKVSEANLKKIPIFTLSFGDHADRKFLQKISLKNQGFSKHIYEAADASLQLEDFYRQICSPLLSNIHFKYIDKAKNVTRTHFPILFEGSELFTSGNIDPGFVPPLVEGWGCCGRVEFIPQVVKVPSSLERLWAYLTIKKLLEQRQIEDNIELTAEALRLSLKYSFVTDVSSLLVVKPDSTSAVNTEDASKASVAVIENRMLASLFEAQGALSERRLCSGQRECSGYIDASRFMHLGYERACSVKRKTNRMLACLRPRPLLETEYYQMNVAIDIRNIYMETKIISKIRNPIHAAHTFTFPVFVPARALITYASLTTNNRTSIGDVQDINTAKKTFDEAFAKGVAASYIQLKEGSSDVFVVILNLPACSDVELCVNYEERLVKNISGNYQVGTAIRPENLTDTLEFDVKINLESSGPLKSLISQYTNQNNITKTGDNKAFIKYENSIKQIFKDNNGGELVILDFGVEEDGIRNNEILVDDGHFINLNSSDASLQNKLVVFLVNDENYLSDTIKEALNFVLEQLQSTDLYTVVQSSAVTKNISLLPASSDNIKQTQGTVGQIKGSTGTNIVSAFESVFKVISESSDSYHPIIVLLSDLDHLDNVKTSKGFEKIVKFNIKNIPILSILNGGIKQVCLFESLQNNHGFYRRIYSFSDVKSQLAYYYTQLSQAVSLKKSFKDIHETTDKPIGPLPLHISKTAYSRFERHEAYKVVQKGGSASLIPLEELKFKYEFVTDSTALLMV